MDREYWMPTDTWTGSTGCQQTHGQGVLDANRHFDDVNTVCYVSADDPVQSYKSFQ